jgi:quercetin dioxygenase-like cupin family protein
MQFCSAFRQYRCSRYRCTICSLTAEMEAEMHERTDVETMTAGLTVGVTRSAQDSGMAKLTPIHREVVTGLPRSAEQEMRVLHATLLSGDVTPYHSHRFPVTVYMIEGAFTLELDGREPVVIKAGQVFVEPAGVNMISRRAIR